LVGHHPGKAQIVRRIKLVNPNQLVRSIRKPKNAIKELTGSLPGLLAAQNKELDALSFDRGYGDNFSSAICKKLYRNSNKPHCIGRVPDTQRVTSELSQWQSGSAATRGQTGLEWHFGETRNIAEQAETARPSISQRKKFPEQVAHIQMGGLFLLKALTHTDVTHLRSMANAPSEYEALAPILSSRALCPTAQTNVCHQL
jgi:hypothetical protein